MAAFNLVSFIYWNLQDDEDHKNLFAILENEIVPTYYTQKDKWAEIVNNSMADITPRFDSHRMVEEYYEKLYNA